MYQGIYAASVRRNGVSLECIGACVPDPVDHVIVAVEIAAVGAERSPRRLERDEEGEGIYSDGQGI